MIKKWIKKLIREVLQEDNVKIYLAPDQLDKVSKTILGTPEYKREHGTKIDFSPLHQPAPINFGDPDAKVVAKIAERIGIPVIWFKPEQALIRFGDASMFIDVWYSKMTVATNINHPTKGWNRLYRKHVSLAELEKIMAYPRQHTGKGYRKK